MKLWDKAQALYEIIDELAPKQQTFIANLVEHADPNNIYEEVNERQIQWLNWLYAKYIEGVERPEW